MFSNYFKIAWRNIVRHKVYTAINVLGLALGICACMVIYLITSYDLSFDRFHPDEDRIYRIVGEAQRASAAGIAALLSKDFIKLVGIAVLIASSIAWWFMHSWLQDFAYRTTISWWVFAVAALAAVLIALTAISFQSIKAAIANPVKSLRTE